MKEIRKKLSFGQSLVEVVIALTVLVIVLSGLAKTVTTSLKNSQYSRNKNFSLNLIQQKIESLRQERDSSPWETFWGNYLGGGPGNTPKVYSEENLDGTGVVNSAGGIFTRTTTFKNLSDNLLDQDKMEIQVIISWLDGQKTYSSSSTVRLTKWRD